MEEGGQLWWYIDAGHFGDKPSALACAAVLVADEPTSYPRICARLRIQRRSMPACGENQSGEEEEDEDAMVLLQGDVSRSFCCSL
jgi:hypothetical protein